MSVEVVTHINFRGQARAALEFYQTVFGGELTAVTYGDMKSAQDPADAALVMWGQVAGPSGFKVMAFDVTARVPYEAGRNPFYISARFSTAEEATAVWGRLRSDGEVRQELGPAPWAPLYGMVQDQFGVVWVIDVVAGQSAH